MRVNWAHGIMFLAVGLVVGYAGFRFDQSHGPNPASASSVEILGLVESKEFTQGDIQATRPSDFLNLERQLHELRAQALEGVIQEELINLEAAARSMEPADLIRIEVDEKLEEPSDEAIAAFFRERRLQGSLEQLTPQIRSYLQNQARVASITSFVATLETQYAVERRLPPLRTQVASDGFPSKGPPNAPVTIVEFSDFQCPYCRVLLAALAQVEETYGDQIRFVFRQFPLINVHPQAVGAAEASLCANEQGGFWEMRDAMFANQRALETEQLKTTARDIGLDGEEFDLCMDTGRYTEAVVADLDAGQAVGVRGTPMIFINGRALSGARTFEEIAEIIDDELEQTGR